MSATRYKKPHVDILICIEMTRERNLGIKKTPGIFLSHAFYVLLFEKIMNLKKRRTCEPHAFSRSLTYHYILVVLVLTRHCCRSRYTLKIGP